MYYTYMLLSVYIYALSTSMLPNVYMSALYMLPNVYMSALSTTVVCCSMYRVHVYCLCLGESPMGCIEHLLYVCIYIYNKLLNV